MPPATSHQPRCAVCLYPITKAQEFVLADTEAMHLACVKERGTTASVGNQRKQRIAELVGSQGQLIADLQYANGRIAELAKYQRDHERRIELEREVARLKLVEREYAGREEDYRRTRNEARAERDAATAALQAANREIALLREMGASRVAATPAADPVTQDDGKDATEKRFSLLELD